MKKSYAPKVAGSGKRLSKIVIRPLSRATQPHLARAHLGQVTVLAAIGQAGLTHRKREGDKASPIGAFALRLGFFRPDRLARPSSARSLAPITRAMGWCDDVSAPSYNRPVPSGGRYRHETLWRDDRVYDVVLTTSHNQRPRIRGGGSAIFLHVARPGYQPTEGCVAISLADMRRMLPRLGRRVLLQIKA